MFEADIKYDFHDAALISSYFENKNLILEVQLYKIFYPNENKIRLTFSDVFNVEKVMKLNQELNTDKVEDWLGDRVEALYLDTKKTSKEEDIYVFVRIDYAQPITIHCKQLKIEEI